MRIAGRNDRPSLLDRAPADLVLWGGRPAAIIALGTNANPHAHSGPDWAQFQRSCVTAIQSNGALVLVEPDRRCEGVEDLDLPALHEKRRLWEVLAPEGVRVSVVGVPGRLFGPIESRARGRCEEAVMNLILFLATRGFGSVAAVGMDGAVQLC